MIWVLGIIPDKAKSFDREECIGSRFSLSNMMRFVM